MPATIISLPAVRAARQLAELYEGFRTLEYADVLPAVADILGRMRAADAIAATREFGLRSPQNRRQCIGAIARAISERKESWDRVSSIGGSSPFVTM